MKITRTILGGEVENGGGDWSTVTYVTSDVKTKSETVKVKLKWRSKIVQEMEGVDAQHILEGLAQIWNRESRLQKTDVTEPDWPQWHRNNGSLFTSDAQPTSSL